MAKEIHIYTAGNDPFVLPLANVTFYVHQGLPALDLPPPEPPTAATPEIHVPNKLGAPYQNFIVAPQRSEELGAILDAQGAESIDLGVAVDEAAAADPSAASQARALLDDLSGRRPLPDYLVEADDLAPA